MVRRNKSTPPSRTHVCPLCNKMRLVRPHDYEVSGETREIKTPRGEVLSIPRDVCSFCEQKIIKKHFQPQKADVKKVLKSMEGGEVLDSDRSLEELL